MVFRELSPSANAFFYRFGLPTDRLSLILMLSIDAGVTMATKEICSYPSGFDLAPTYSMLMIDPSAVVGGSGVTTSASATPTISNQGSVHGQV